MREKKQYQSSEQLALYPIDEIRKLYAERMAYEQAKNYIEYLERENDLLKQQLEKMKTLLEVATYFLK